MPAEYANDNGATVWNKVRANVYTILVGLYLAMPPEELRFTVQNDAPLSSGNSIAFGVSILVRNLHSERCELKRRSCPRPAENSFAFIGERRQVSHYRGG